MKLEISAGERITRDTSHHRLSVLRDARATLVAIADGIGADAASHAAAALAVRELAHCFRNGVLPNNPKDWEMILEGIDFSVFKDPVAGETSALVMCIRDDVVVGAAVGDSLAYMVSSNGGARLLAGAQGSVPLVGTAMAQPIGFGPVQLDGKLITRRPGSIDARYLPLATAAA
jgi:hypothetical protein